MGVEESLLRFTGEGHIVSRGTFLSTIHRLFFRGRPSTIRRFVIASGIRESIEAFPNGPFPHIAEKRLKARSPRLADFDSVTAPILISRCIGIFATLFHLSPSDVFTGPVY
jgi:hypothetical protein